MKGIVAVNLSVSGTSTTPTGAANDAAYHLAKSTFRCALTKRLRSSFPPHSNALEVDHVELLGDAVPSTLMFDVTAAEFLRVLAGTGCLDDFLARLIRPALAETEGLELKDARIVVVARGFDIASEGSAPTPRASSSEGATPATAAEHSELWPVLSGCALVFATIALWFNMTSSVHNAVDSTSQETSKSAVTDCSNQPATPPAAWCCGTCEHPETLVVAHPKDAPTHDVCCCDSSHCGSS